MATYTDASGNVTTTTYDVAGRVATVNDGKATRTYIYDTTEGHRGLATSIVDNADGALESQTYPGGLQA